LPLGGRSDRLPRDPCGRRAPSAGRARSAGSAHGVEPTLPPAPGPPAGGIAPHDYVYFVHSYAVPVSSNTLASAHYGEPLSAIVRHRNFWGTQFHPERSAATGARLLANFLRLG